MTVAVSGISFVVFLMKLSPGLNSVRAGHGGRSCVCVFHVALPACHWEWEERQMCHAVVMGLNIPEMLIAEECVCFWLGMNS